MKNRTNKVLAVALAITLLALAAVVGTLAYLTKETAAIKNVFTKGEGVDIDLLENGSNISTYEVVTDAENDEFLYYQKDYTYTPGNYAQKTVEVENTGAADCYVFIMVEKGEDFDTYAFVEVDDVNWELVTTTNASNETNGADVYAYVGGTGDIAPLEVGDTTAPLYADQNGENSEVEYLNKTTDALANWTGSTDVSLKFTAFAIQTTGWDTPTADSVWTNFWAG